MSELREYKPGTAFPGVIGRTKVAEVSKKWFRLRDSHGVEVASDQNDVVILAVTVAVDMMAHAGRTNV
jgi:uncharacterized protein YxjI